MSIRKRPADPKMTLRHAREAIELTQAYAAEMLGISKDTLRSYEKGRTYPDVPMIRRMEALYGVRYDQLLFLPSDFG